MHIYYYYKNGYYYVRNTFGVLEKYTVTNNIDQILQLENLITYFTELCESEPNQFPIKAIQEYNLEELTNIFFSLPLILMTQYSLFEEKTIPLFFLEASILNILNHAYYEEKNTIQKKDKFYEELLEEQIIAWQEQLQFLKEISHYKKEIVPLSELDNTQEKTYLKDVKELADSYRDIIDIELAANFDPLTFFEDDIDSELKETFYLDFLDIDIHNIKENNPIFQKEKKAREEYYQTQFFSLYLKLDRAKLKDAMTNAFNLANGAVIINTLIHLVPIPFLNNKENWLTSITILINIICYIKYYNKKRKLNITPDNILRLKK